MTTEVKTSYVLFGLSLTSLFLHSAFFSLFGIEEVIFCILSLLLALGFGISIIYNIITYIARGEPKDLWKIGWLGLFGLLGINYDSVFYGLFGLFAFFGFKKDIKEFTSVK